MNSIYNLRSSTSNKRVAYIKSKVTKHKKYKRSRLIDNHSANYNVNTSLTTIEKNETCAVKKLNDDQSVTIYQHDHDTETNEIPATSKSELSNTLITQPLTEKQEAIGYEADNESNESENETITPNISSIEYRNSDWGFLGIPKLKANNKDSNSMISAKKISCDPKETKNETISTGLSMTISKNAITNKYEFIDFKHDRNTCIWCLNEKQKVQSLEHN